MSDTTMFLGYESAPIESALFSVIPAPSEESATYVGGQAAAPLAIMEASSQIEDFDEETGITLVDMGVHYLAAEEAPTDESLATFVKENVQNAIDNTTVPVILGGTGSVSLWAVGKLAESCESLSILHLDAHSNLNEAEEGEESNHTVMRQALEISPKISICQAGVRSLSKDGYERIIDSEQPVECFFMSDIARYEDEEWQEDIIKELSSPVYVSIDLSVFDPGTLASVGNPEPGGLVWSQVTRLLKKLAGRRRIAGFDIVELCPREGDINSDYTAAKLAYKLMNYIYSGGKMLEKVEAAPVEADEEE